MFLEPESFSIRPAGFPHAGGDVSEALSSPVGGYVFSPRRWGCFRDEVVPVENRKVFPTQVGMFP